MVLRVKNVSEFPPHTVIPPLLSLSSGICLFFSTSVSLSFSLSLYLPLELTSHLGKVSVEKDVHGCTMYIRHRRVLPFFQEKSLCRTKLHKKGSRKIFFLLKKVIAILRSIIQYCVSTARYLTEKVYINNAVLEKFSQNFLK